MSHVSQLLKSFGAGAIACAVLGLAAPATGQILFQDGFGDGDRDNDGNLDGPVENAADVGVPWYKVKSSDEQTFSVVNDATFGSNAFDIVSSGPGGTSDRPTTVAQFQDTTLNDGDKLTFMFDVRVTQTSIPDADRRFRWGIFNAPAGTQVSSDSDSSGATINNWSGWIGRVDTGGNTNSSTLAITQNDAGSLLSADNFLDGETDNLVQLDDNDVHSVMMTLERDGDHIIIESMFDTLMVSRSTEDEIGNNGPFGFTYNAVAIGTNGLTLDFALDNIKVSVERIPEPTAMSLLALGAVPMLRRRR